MSFTKGRHQFNVGAWFQRLRSNENLALSQYGQATFTSLQTFLQGTVATLLYDPTPTPLGWRSWFGALYAEDVIRVTPKLTLSLGFRDEFTTGWNEVHGRAATYTFPNGIISSQPTIGTSAFTVNKAKFLPQPRVGLAWSPFSNKHTTVIRAGFGMYNDLQDALGYRTDQNAPFNPTYSLPTVAGLSTPGLADCAGSRHREAGARRSAAGSENAHADLLVVPNPTGTDGQYRSHGRICRISRISRNHRHRCQRAFPRDLSGCSVSGELIPSTFPAGYRGHADSRRNLLRSDRDQAQCRDREHLDLFFGGATVPTTPCRWT